MGNQINKPTDYFNTVLNTGDDTSPKSITGFNFQPDLVWTKTRTYGNNHTLFDSVRSAGSGKEISSNSTAEEGSATINTATYGYLSSFDSDGFTATSGSSGINYFNQSGSTYVNWGWLAGGSASSNTDGSITSSVSANTTSGFSIVSYTGTGANATVGHGLGSAPKIIFVKCRSNADNWLVYNGNSGGTKYLILNATNAEATQSNIWNDTDATSSVFSLGTSSAVNGSTRTYIAYCFAEKKGFSKFGTYTGNGNADGTFVYTGFKPAFIMIKQSSGSGTSWNMWDNKRVGFNVNNWQIEANTNAVENTSLTRMVMLSNGFKCNTDNAQINGSGNTYIYMAFAQNPLVGTNNIPACAR